MSIQDSEQKDYINVKGCVPQFEKWLQDNLTLVAGIFIGVALLQASSIHVFSLHGAPDKMWNKSIFTIYFFLFVMLTIDLVFFFLSSTDFWDLFGPKPSEWHWGCAGKLVRKWSSSLLCLCMYLHTFLSFQAHFPWFSSVFTVSISQNRTFQLSFQLCHSINAGRIYICGLHTCTVRA